MTTAELEEQDFFLLLQEQALQSMSVYKLSWKVSRGTTAGQINCMREKAARASSEIVYSQRKWFRILYLQCVSIVYSLVIPTQLFVYHLHGKKSLSHLASGLLNSEQSIHDSSRCSCSHQKATSKSEAKRWLISQTDGLSSVSHHDSALPERMAFADHSFGLTAWTAFLSERILNHCPPYLCDSIVFNTMQTVEKFIQLLQCVFPKVSEK